MITADDFEAWRAHPVTEWVAKALTTAAQQAETQAKDAAWSTGFVDPVAHARIHARAEAYLDLASPDFTDLQTLNGEGA